MKLMEECFGKQALKPVFLCSRSHDTCADKRHITRGQMHKGAGVCYMEIFVKAVSAHNYMLYYFSM